MPWTISKGTPIISCSKALNPSCSKLRREHRERTRFKWRHMIFVPLYRSVTSATTKQILIEPVLQKKINVWWVELRTRRAWTCSWRSATLVHGGRDGRPGGSSWSQADRSAAPTCLAWCHSTWTRWSEMTPNCQFLTVLTYPFTYSLTHYWCKAGNCAEKHCAS